MILVSACLLGKNCKYNGGNNLDKELMDFLKDKEYIMVCPEELGGLSTPRASSEIIGGSTGEDVLEGRSSIVDNKGKNVTEAFIKGAEETLRIVKLHNIKTAILKEQSPSCGSSKIYDGSFTFKLKEGEGVVTALLRKNGVVVFSEQNYMKNILQRGKNK